MTVLAPSGALPRLSCPACRSPVCGALFGRQEWARQFTGSDDQRRAHAEAMEAEPALAFGTMRRCKVCGTLFTDRVPPAKALDAFYQARYSNDFYLNKADRKLALEKRRIFFLKWLTGGRRFLDVGCNIGCAVEAARANGFTATGLDVTAYAVRAAQQRFPRNRFIQGTLDDLDPGSAFDLVFCTEVIEHVPDPAGFVGALARVVAPGGILFLTTPDAGHVSVRDHLMRWEVVRPPEHLTLFTKAGLRQALRAGFRTVFFFPDRKPGIQLIARRGWNNSSGIR